MICKQQHKNVETMDIAFYWTRYFVNCTPCTELTLKLQTGRRKEAYLTRFDSYSASCVWRAGTIRPGFMIMKAEASFERLVTWFTAQVCKCWNLIIWRHHKSSCTGGLFILHHIAVTDALCEVGDSYLMGIDVCTCWSSKLLWRVSQTIVL